MRLPFPERIPLKSLFYFAAGLCALQLAEGTDKTFSLCCFFYILVAGYAFNVAGGMTRPSGAYIFFNALLSVILGLCWKAFLGEPAESNLLSPLLTISVYLGGMIMMLMALSLSRMLVIKRAVLGDILPAYKMQRAIVGCMVAGGAVFILNLVSNNANGSATSAINQIDRFFPLAVILGVVHTIRSSGGRRSVNLPILLSCGFMFFTGVVGFSKQGMMTPFACWGLAAASQRYRVSRGQLVFLVLVVLFISRYLVPYSQYGRNFKQDTFKANIGVSASLLSNLGEVRQQYLNESVDAYDNKLYAFYDTPQGFLDRLQMFSIDDALINYTDKFGTFGLYPLVESIENIVPHFIWKGKPSFLAGNVFAHEVGILSSGDESTGVSFSASASAFHMAGWMGIFLLAPAVWFALFWIFDSLCGDIRQAPWGLLVMVILTHAAAEGDITALIYLLSMAAFTVTAAAYLTAYLMPIIGAAFVGPERTFVKTIALMRPLPRRLPPRSSEA